MLRQFAATLEKSDFPEPVKRGARCGLSLRAREFLGHPENRGQRRIRRVPVRRVRKTLKHITHAVRHAHRDDGHEDANVRTEAKELVRSAQYYSLEKTEARAREFA